MNTFKSFPNTLSQLYSWWWLRPRSSATIKHSDQRRHSGTLLASEIQENQYCAKCQLYTGVTAASAGHRHRLKDTGQCEKQLCHCQHNQHQSSSILSSPFSSSVSVLSSADQHQHHMCNMCQHRPSRNAAQSTCRARKSSTQIVLVFYLLFQLLLVSLAHGNINLTPLFDYLCFYFCFEGRTVQTNAVHLSS